LSLDPRPLLEQVVARRQMMLMALFADKNPIDRRFLFALGRSHAVCARKALRDGAQVCATFGREL